MKCPHFDSLETKPIHTGHALARQLIASALNLTAETHYHTIGAPSVDSLPAQSADAITKQFLADRSRRDIPEPAAIDMKFSKGFLQHGIADSFRLFASATSAKGLPTLEASRHTHTAHARKDTPPLV